MHLFYLSVGVFAIYHQQSFPALGFIVCISSHTWSGPEELDFNKSFSATVKSLRVRERRERGRRWLIIKLFSRHLLQTNVALVRHLQTAQSAHYCWCLVYSQNNTQFKWTFKFVSIQYHINLQSKYQISANLMLHVYKIPFHITDTNISNLLS